MKLWRLVMLVTFVSGLFFVLPSSTHGQSGSVGIYSVAACRDSATVAVMGATSFATNRVWARVFVKNDNGEYQELETETTDPFGAGRVSVAIVVAYPKKSVATGTELRIEAQLQRLSGNSYVDVGPRAVQYARAADRDCLGSCSVTVDTSDAAPADGTITLRSHYGSWFRPEGWLHGALPVRAGRRARVVFSGLSCGWTARAWYYPKSGDTTPRMLPAQYWPDEYAATVADGTNPYSTSFASGLPATHPVEADDPFVTR